MRNLNNKPSSSAYRDKIDYILNACLYCWYLWISKAGIAMQNSLNKLIRLLVSIFLPQKYLYKLCRKQVNGKKELDIVFRDLESGIDISTATELVIATCGGYLAFPIAAGLGIISKLIGWNIVLFWNNGIIGYSIVIMVGVLLYIGLTILTKALYDPHVYLSYFKKFKKRDEEWLKKWKRYTILLFVGNFVSAAMGIGFVFFLVMHT